MDRCKSFRSSSTGLAYFWIKKEYRRQCDLLFLPCFQSLNCRSFVWCSAKFMVKDLDVQHCACSQLQHLELSTCLWPSYKVSLLSTWLIEWKTVTTEQLWIRPVSCQSLDVKLKIINVEVGNQILKTQLDLIQLACHGSRVESRGAVSVYLVREHRARHRIPWDSEKLKEVKRCISFHF